MVDDTGGGRRYCSVCGYLSSEPVPACPHCTLSSARVPQVAPAPLLFPQAPYPVASSRGPPAWAVIAAILLIVVLAIVIALAMDGVFSSPSSTSTPSTLIPQLMGLLASRLP